ncbi:MAG: phage portal protein [Brevundimonas sp.]|uniref:phage portal protein n=1 Tax=Brevundimonas sp. TaxID=1871086 RepID=UPI001A2AFAA8|nr:phage portal protein [Brevundimonas sp.]MBJ7446842.1 phage portal protein [Brevundimonas sp.]
MVDRPTDLTTRFIDGLIERLSPQAARRRMAERLALNEMRQYDAAGHGRRTSGWRRSGGSAEREVRSGLIGLRNGARELVRNNKYAAAALRQMTANVVGDGITARMTHADEKIAKRAQEEWDRWAESRVDGREDHYGQQKLLFRSVAEGGEGLAIWSPRNGEPDSRCDIVEGDLLDHTKEFEGTDKRIVQGVEFDRQGDRAGYWLFDSHPGDFRGFRGTSRRYSAEHVDHVFEALRPGQPRGVSWFAPVAMTLRDLADYEEAILMKRKVEACLALILTPPDTATTPTPFAEAGVGGEGGEGQTAGGPTNRQRGGDMLRPAMIMRARPGETATQVNPSSGGDGVEFARQQLMGISANLAPYFLISGDPSRTNYSSQRALMLAFWSNLDDWQQNMMLPQFCMRATERRNRWLAVKTGDRRFLEVKPQFAMPQRRLLDPGRDMEGLERELRLGATSYPAMLSSRGINPDSHLAEIAAFYEKADKLGLVLDGDPRRTARSGSLQPATGYVRPRDDD